MFDLLQHLFGWVCGQDPGHTWSLGGVLLPFCQRCAGLYLGAFVAACVHLLIRPAPTIRWLCLNGVFLLCMVPFGFHWLPQGPVLRAITGVLFGFGLTAYLTLMLHNSSGAGVPPLRFQADGQEVCPTTRPVFWLPLLGALFLVPWLGAYGNTLAANTLMLLTTVGALALAGLVLANVALALRWMIRRLVNRTERAVA